jgi:hypothetical protein
MNFRVQCQLEYTLHNPSTFFFAVRGVAAGGQKILSESLTTDPFVPFEEFDNVGGMNRITRRCITRPPPARITQPPVISRLRADRYCGVCG